MIFNCLVLFILKIRIYQKKALGIQIMDGDKYKTILEENKIISLIIKND